MIRIRCDRFILPTGLFAGYLYIEDGVIRCLSRDCLPAEEVYDLTGKTVSPGWIDLHTHGGGGFAFMDSQPEDVIAGCRFHAAHGTTTLLPTVSAAPFDIMRRSARSIALAKLSGMTVAHVPGAHLEGPYLSAKQCGAQCPDFITPPIPGDYEGLVEELSPNIARWTFAPENDPNGVFAAFLTGHHILPSAGHTDARYPEMMTAIEHGCRLVTHLYSCTSTVTRDHGFRSLGVIETAFLRDDLFAEIIADGKHLPTELIRMIVKIKGVSRVAAVTDSLAIAGTDILSGTMSGTDFIVEDGVCKLKDRSAFAGSVATADRLAKVLLCDCGFSLSDTAALLSRTPARIMGWNKGALAPGMDADLTVFDDDIHVTDLFVGGIHYDTGSLIP